MTNSEGTSPSEGEFERRARVRAVAEQFIVDVSRTGSLYEADQNAFCEAQAKATKCFPNTAISEILDKISSCASNLDCERYLHREVNRADDETRASAHRHGVYMMELVGLHASLDSVFGNYLS